MTKKQAREFIQQLSPSTGETEINILLDNAVKEFTVLTEILNDVKTVTTQSSVLYYPFSLFSGSITADDIIRIRRVDYADTIMDKLAGEIKNDDLSEAV